ncbi:midasin-like isoform X2 [Coccinella septempunctata]|uniref:midasin-like isoform X2 n=1 Tax=Coccinella septempunctata TaxID=41139 RepID=UPI001D07714D|nr:midasin-like isoform X2 [Coccinella septempunctata]
MMSERKRKQKWSLNPRGKDWSENSNKFGQKLMEKMGWSTGKGLGAKEDGMTEHIRVAYKNDTQGMGYKDRDDQWTEHESNFTELLNTLVGPKECKGAESSKELKVESLEKKSQVSKARVHYHKFTRGKDLSRYSEKDLANIFGKKSLEDLSSKSQNIKEDNNEKENQTDKTFGVVTLNGGSMMDYFKNKLPTFKKNMAIGSSKNDDSESDSGRTNFGFGFTQKDENVGEEDVSENCNKRDKKKGKKDHVDNFRKPCFGLGYDRYNGDESDRKTDYSSFVKATETIVKKAPNTEDKSSNSKKSVFGFGFNSDNNKKQSSFMTFVSGDVEGSEIKEQLNEDVSKMDKKRKKKSDAGSIDEDEDTKTIKKMKTNGLGISDKSNDEVIRKKKKKEKNLKPSFVSFVSDGNESVSTDVKKKKNKNKCKNKVIDSVEPDNNIEVENNSPQVKNKKNKTSRDENDGADDTIVDEIVHAKKGKKRKSESEIDIAFTPVTKKFKNFEDLHSLQDEAKIVQTPDKDSKKSKRKKKSKNCSDEIDEKNGLANPAFDPLYNEIILEKHHLDAIVEETENSVESTIVESREQAVVVNTSLQSNTEKKMKKKKSKANLSIEENSTIEVLHQPKDESDVCETPERKKSKKSKKKKEHLTNGVENSAFDENYKDEQKFEDEARARVEVESFVTENSIVGKTKEKKKKSKMNEIYQDSQLNKYEVRRGKKNEKNLGILNPGLDLTDDDKSLSLKEELPVCDDSLMLNIVCTPIIKKDNESKLQRRKSVRFSNINESIFINKTDSPADLRKNGEGGLDNAGYDQFGNRIEENIDTLSKQLDDYQAEVENDLNEAKMQVMVGEVGDPAGENEILPSGEVKLKFKYANFGRMPPWMKKANSANPKSSYRHLIKGDIVLGFRNTNMHDIKGYGENLKTSCT